MSHENHPVYRLPHGYICAIKTDFCFFLIPLLPCSYFSCNIHIASLHTGSIWKIRQCLFRIPCRFISYCPPMKPCSLDDLIVWMDRLFRSHNASLFTFPFKYLVSKTKTTNCLNMRERGGVQSHEMFDLQKPSHCLFPGFSSMLKLKLSFDFF